MAGKPDRLVVKSPYDGSVVGEVRAASPAEIDDAATSARAAFEAFRRRPAFARAGVLKRAAALVRERRDDLARGIVRESGKPLKDARVEADRCAHTLETASEEAVRIPGDALSFDGAPEGEGRFAVVRRFPVGAVLAISPFNFPLNLPAHKVGPAIAAGASVLLKPSEKTPISALALERIFVEAGIPDPRAFRVLVTAREDAGRLVGDPRFALISFTGSPEVGWKLKAAAGRARVVLELGGNAAVVIHEDADVESAAARCVAGAFSVAGQSCVSVQRIIVHERVADDFLAAFLPRVKALRTGDPLLETTDVGPLVDSAAADRVSAWIDRAVAAGAARLAGGGRSGNILEPTVLLDVRKDLEIYCREAFGPVVTVERYSEFDDALARADASEFGLQAGVFTGDMERIHRAFERLEVGAVLANEVPTWRYDPMPYGGVKASGIGREGVRSAIEHMTEPRLLVLSLPPRGGG